MKQVLFAALSLVGINAHSQMTDSLSFGIHFDAGLSWNEVVSKAKLEKKDIFVDCYTTWCGPCKKMEREVYPIRRVGDYFNKRFISIKVQMDTTKNDGAATKTFYSDAQLIARKYKVDVYPTLLFFNSEGNIMNRALGAMDADALVKIAMNTQDAQKDYYALLKQYNLGRRDLREMAFLARTAISLLGDTTESDTIAKDYLSHLHRNDWFTRTNIEFMQEFTRCSTDPGFTFFYQNSDSINAIMKTWAFSQGLIQNILNQEIVAPELLTCSRLKVPPSWERMDSIISRRYGPYYADRTITGAKADWYGRHKKWREHTKWLVLYVEQFAPRSDSGGPLESLYLNNCAWDVFLHSCDKSELEFALKWSLLAIQIDPGPGWMDTYANILYKLKRRDAAMKWEGLAVALGRGDKAIMSNFESMKEGKPTWPEN